MLDFDDPRWEKLEGGYRLPYDPRAALTKLERSESVAAVWDELWQELHHQGDVGTASYAAVPHLLRVHIARDVPDWNTFALVGLIEEVRHSANNPEMPALLQPGYEQAWKDIVSLALRDLSRSDESDLTRAALGVIAISRGLRRAGEILLVFTDDELEEMVAEYR